MRAESGDERTKSDGLQKSVRIIFASHYSHLKRCLANILFFLAYLCDWNNLTGTWFNHEDLATQSSLHALSRRVLCDYTSFSFSALADLASRQLRADGVTSGKDPQSRMDGGLVFNCDITMISYEIQRHPLACASSADAYPSTRL